MKIKRWSIPHWDQRVRSEGSASRRLRSDSTQGTSDASVPGTEDQLFSVTPLRPHRAYSLPSWHSYILTFLSTDCRHQDQSSQANPAHDLQCDRTTAADDLAVSIGLQLPYTHANLDSYTLHLITALYTPFTSSSPPSRVTRPLTPAYDGHRTPWLAL